MAGKATVLGTIVSAIGILITLLPHEGKSGNQTTYGSQSPAIGENRGHINITYGKESASSRKRFEGEIGNFNKGKRFADFILNNSKEIVYFDVYRNASYDDNSLEAIELVSNTFNINYFWIYSECQELKENEKPSREKCQGYDIFIDHSLDDKDADAIVYRDKLRLKGFFVIKGCEGMHMGFESCTLRPLNVDSAQ